MTSLFILFLVLLASIANVLGGWLITRKKYTDYQMCVIVALTAGFLLAIALIDLIPSSIALNAASPYFTLAGFAVMLFINVRGHSHIEHAQVLAHHPHDTHAHREAQNREAKPQHAQKKATTIGIQTAMLIHTFFDGFSITAAYLTNPTIGLLVFIAVFMHKIPDGMTLSSVLLARTKDTRKALLGSVGLGLSTIGGCLVMLLIHYTGLGFPQDTVTAVALAFSAGIFLYVTAADLIPEIYQSRHLGIPLWIVTGIMIFFVLEFIVERLGLSA